MLRKDYLKKISYQKRSTLAKAANIINRSSLVAARRNPFSSGGSVRGRYRSRGPSELKTIDTTATNASPVATGSVVLLNGVATGDDYNTRDGRKIQMKSILLRILLSPDTTQSAPQGDIMRVMIVYDKQTNGTALTAANVLQTGVIQSPNNLNNRDRFVVLSDKFLTLPSWVFAAGALTQGGPTPKYLKIYKPLNLDTIYNSASGAIADISTGSLYLIMLTAREVSSVNYHSRIRFTEP